MENRTNPLLEKSYAFALSIVDLCHALQDNDREYVLSKQLSSSGTSIGALSEDSQQAESKADFIHKLSIANKEAHESHYWLRLIRDRKKFQVDVSKYLLDCEELKKLWVSIIKSFKK